MRMQSTEGIPTLCLIAYIAPADSLKLQSLCKAPYSAFGIPDPDVTRLKVTECWKRSTTVLEVSDVYCAYCTQQPTSDKQNTKAAHVSSLCAKAMRALFP